jgi:hypothetical protein
MYVRIALVIGGNVGVGEVDGSDMLDLLSITALGFLDLIIRYLVF